MDSDRLYRAMIVARACNTTLAKLTNWDRLGLVPAAGFVSAKNSKVYDDRRALAAYCVAHLRPAALAELEKLTHFLIQSPLLDLGNIDENAEIAVHVSADGGTAFYYFADRTDVVRDETGRVLEPPVDGGRNGRGAATVHRVWLHDALCRLNEGVVAALTERFSELEVLVEAADRKATRMANALLKQGIDVTAEQAAEAA